MRFLIYSHSKSYLEYDDIIKKNNKTKQYEYECLYEFFKCDELNKHRHNYRYYLTSYKIKKHGYLNVKFYFRKTYIGVDNAETIGVFNLRFNIDEDEHKYLKKFPVNEVIGIEKDEDEDDVLFYIKVKDQRIITKPPEVVKMITECNICYENNKDTHKIGFFICIHKDICFDCYNKMNNIKRCPICRAVSLCMLN